MSITHQIDLAAAADAPEIMTFMDRHWKRGHVLSRSRELLDWQYFDATANRYNIVIARNPSDHQIDGLMGFIPTRNFDPALAERADYWLAIWKVRDEVSAPGLGILIFEYFKNRFNPRSICSIGISEVARRIYRAMQFQIGHLNHLYLLDPNRSNFRLAEIPTTDGSEPTGAGAAWRLEAIDRTDPRVPHFFSKARTPQKSWPYFVRRYFEHPFYRYLVYGGNRDGQLESVFVFRIASAQGANALRMVDFLTLDIDENRDSSPFVDLLRVNDAEFIDAYTTPAEAPTLQRFGFSLKASNGPIIPNYFEPFERRNVDLEYAYWPKTLIDYQIRKGDSDQDRPNLLEQGEKDL